MTSRRQFLAASTASAALAGCATLRADCDLLIRNGTLYDGSGGAPFTGDVAVRGNQIIAVGNVTDRKSTRLNSSHIPLSRMPSSA